MGRFLARACVALIFGSGCGFDAAGGSGSGTDSDSGSSGDGNDVSTSASPGTSTTRADTTVAEDTTGDTTVEDDTSAEDDTTSSTGDETSGLDTMTESSDSGNEDTTTGEPVACTRTHELLALAEDAVLTGDWTLEMSQIGEGMYANPNGSEPGGEGTLTFAVDVPCADDWYVWARFYDWGGQDSWYIRVDGEQGSKEAIFEGDCTQTGSNWDWAVMNYRETTAGSCDYLYDPWVQTWDPGQHTVEFEIREHSSLARIIVVNDPGFTP
jgi:hypothetical protein